jgi:hypothetical protein
MTANAELVGLAAIKWRRLDLAALELEPRTSPAKFVPAWQHVHDIAVAQVDPDLKAIDKQWKRAAKAAAEAHDDFMALLDEATPEQEIMGE